MNENSLHNDFFNYVWRFSISASGFLNWIVWVLVRPSQVSYCMRICVEGSNDMYINEETESNLAEPLTSTGFEYTNKLPTSVNQSILVAYSTAMHKEIKGHNLQEG